MSRQPFLLVRSCMAFLVFCHVACKIQRALQIWIGQVDCSACMCGGRESRESGWSLEPRGSQQPGGWTSAAERISSWTPTHMG